jgi:phage gpG-like protein
VVVESQLDYSAIHNEGGTITVTKQMKKYWWSQYYKFAKKTKTTKSGNQSNSAANKKLNAKAQYCKNMALIKVGSKIKIPKRQFMGASKILMNSMEKQLQTIISKSFQNQ